MFYFVTLILFLPLVLCAIWFSRSSRQFVIEYARVHGSGQDKAVKKEADVLREAIVSPRLNAKLQREIFKRHSDERLDYFARQFRFRFVVSAIILAAAFMIMSVFMVYFDL